MSLKFLSGFYQWLNIFSRYADLFAEVLLFVANIIIQFFVIQKIKQKLNHLQGNSAYERIMDRNSSIYLVLEFTRLNLKLKKKFLNSLENTKINFTDDTYTN
ncbi:hypothetical protein BpHYR1_028733 [Brachionus plicatilis]|uniref:Uncharacterized protein n=1 Tax=Brachionus plicatilis TaxID=10195 RepID=A0A3M7PL64_BRAPC|nr:hypothetical protein BpHYR1_028733 [Brachionus plicatilis]